MTLCGFAFSIASPFIVALLNPSPLPCPLACQNRMSKTG
jgi:hypothetical protein